MALLKADLDHALAGMNVSPEAGNAGSHHFEEHTSEVQLRIQAPSLTSLFEEAARGLAELLLGGDADRAREAAQTEPVELVRLTGRDRAALLVNWLNELIFLSETQHRVYTRVQVLYASDRELEARVQGAMAEALGTPVKAATLYGLSVEAEAGGFTATVVLDV